MRLLLIRHGQTIDNVRGALGTEVPGPGLTALGQEQADALPPALAGEDIEAIYTSTMLRTQRTAEPLARSRGIRAQVIDGVQEIFAGRLEQRSDDEAVRTYISTIVAWQHDFGARVPGGEDGHQFFGRFNRAIADIASEHDGTVALVSHGAAIRTWASWASGNLDAEFTRSHELKNTGIVIMEGSLADGWVATEWAGEPVGGAQLADANAPDPTGTAP